MKSSIKAIIFDMDGVLIDAKEWHYEALNKALVFFGMPINREDHEGVFDGLPTSKKLNILSERSGLPKRLHPFINDLKQKFTLEKIYSCCRPDFNHEYALSRLSSDGYLLAVASNSIRETVDTMMVRSGLINHLEFCLSNQDVTNGKPSPEIYLTAMNRLGVLPEETLVLEDNVNGIKSAIDSGAHVMIISDVSDVNYTNIRRVIDKLSEVKV